MIKIIKLKTKLKENKLDKENDYNKGIYLQKLILEDLFNKNIEYILIEEADFFSSSFWNTVFKQILRSGVCKTYLNKKIKIKYKKIFRAEPCLYVPLSPNELILLNMNKILKDTKPDLTKLKNFVKFNKFKIIND